MQITPCKTYHAQQAGFTLLHLPDGISVFKIYYLSITGRAQRQRYEWQHCSLRFQDFEQMLCLAGPEGIGFITAFPHITKIFRFSPYNETVLDVTEYDTQGLHEIDCGRGDGSHEFACYAEAAIAAGEYAAWARATDVNEYLAFQYEETDFPVQNPNKLAAYWMIQSSNPEMKR